MSTTYHITQPGGTPHGPYDFETLKGMMARGAVEVSMKWQGGKLIRAGAMDEVKGDTSLEHVFLELEGEQ